MTATTASKKPTNRQMTEADLLDFIQAKFKVDGLRLEIRPIVPRPVQPTSHRQSFRLNYFKDEITSIGLRSEDGMPRSAFLTIVYKNGAYSVEKHYIETPGKVMDLSKRKKAAIQAAVK